MPLPNQAKMAPAPRPITSMLATPSPLPTAPTPAPIETPKWSTHEAAVYQQLERQSLLLEQQVRYARKTFRLLNLVAWIVFIVFVFFVVGILTVSSRIEGL